MRREFYERAKDGRLFLVEAPSTKGKGKGKGKQPSVTDGWQQQQGGWTCQDRECIQDRKVRGYAPMRNRAANTHCYHCGTDKAVSLGSHLTDIQAASVALQEKKKQQAAAAMTGAGQPSSPIPPPTRRQKRNAARAAKQQAADASKVGAPPPPPATHQTKGKADTSQLPAPKSSDAQLGDGTAGSTDAVMEDAAKKHMGLESKAVEDWDLITPLTNRIQTSLAKGIMPKERPQLQTVKERIEKLLAVNPEATAGQTLADATARVEWLQKAYDLPPPGNSDKWVAETKEELDAAKVTLAKLQKRPTDAASSAAALKSGKSRYLLAVAKTTATVEAAQKTTTQLAEERKELRAKARRQIEEMEAAEEKELKEFLEAHRLRGIQRAQEQEEMLAEFDSRIAEVDTTSEDVSTAQPNAAAEAELQAAKAEGAAAQTTVAQLAEQLKKLQEQVQKANEETTRLRNEAAWHQQQQDSMRRYLLVIPVADQELPEVELPPKEDERRLYYMQLHLLLSTWHSRGCVPFQEHYLREQFPDKHVLAGCLDTLLGPLARLWHQGVNADAEKIMPNQMAMVLLRQLSLVLPLTTDDGDDQADVERLTKRATESYDAMVIHAKRLKLSTRA